MGIFESAPRICRSQADHSVTGRIGSVHPIGHPMIQSEKFGLKVRSPGKDRCPAFKLRWSGRENGNLNGRVGVAPHACISSHICVHSRAAFPMPNCDPAAAASSLILKQLLTSSISIFVQ